MTLVIALDERFDDTDLELGRRRGKRLPHLIEREHDLEVVLELGLRNLGVALELLPDSRVEPARVARSKIARGPYLGRRARSR